MNQADLLHRLKTDPKEATEDFLAVLAFLDMGQCTELDDVFVPGEDILVDKKLYTARKGLSKHE